MKKGDKLHLIKDDDTYRTLLVEIKEMILAELDIDGSCTHTSDSPLYETLASLIVTKAPNQE